MVTNTPIGVFRAIVILPSRLDFTVVHRLLRQTSTRRDHGRNEPGDCGLCLDDGLLFANLVREGLPTTAELRELRTFIATDGT
jgi:hypothetical protein